MAEYYITYNIYKCRSFPMSKWLLDDVMFEGVWEQKILMRWFTHMKCFYHTDLTHFFRQMALFLCLAGYGYGAYLALVCVWAAMWKDALLWAPYELIWPTILLINSLILFSFYRLLSSVFISCVMFFCCFLHLCGPVRLIHCSFLCFGW